MYRIHIYCRPVCLQSWMPNPYPCLLHLCKQLWLLVIANWLRGLTFANPRKSSEIWSANSQHRLASSGVSLLRSRSSSPIQVTPVPDGASWRRPEPVLARCWQRSAHACSLSTPSWPHKSGPWTLEHFLPKR